MSGTAPRREVAQAITDLDRQRSQVRLAGRTFLIDVVMQAPDRFSSAVRAALEAELPLLRPAVDPSAIPLPGNRAAGRVLETLDDIRRRGSHGGHPQGAGRQRDHEADRPAGRRRIPVVTLVTDLPRSGAYAYVGIDNRAAGATAAYLIDSMARATTGAVLVALSRSAFRGEEEREMGFRADDAGIRGGRALVEATDTDGIDTAVRDQTISILREHPEITAVYSIGGGNKAILDAFDFLGRKCRVFIAHDLDRGQPCR